MNVAIIAGTASLNLAEKISHEHLMIPLISREVEVFSNGETRLIINDSLRGKDVFIIQSTGYPADSNIMELCMMIHTAKRSSAKSVTAIIPFFGYSRQDRPGKTSLGSNNSYNREPITSKMVADMLQAVGVDHVVNFELHSGQISGFFERADDIQILPTMLDLLHIEDSSTYTVVSPDAGGVVRARQFSKLMGLNENSLAIIDKRRPSPNVSEVMNVIGNVKDKKCILVDDMIDTAGTLCKASDALVTQGAIDVIAVCPHGVLSGNSLSNIKDSTLKTVYISDSIYKDESLLRSYGITVMSISKLVAEIIRKISSQESLDTVYH